MGSSSPNKGRLFDPIRQSWVKATPEEWVRQRLIQKMIGPLGFPKGLLSVEKSLKRAERRIDLLCYTASLEPLLLIECKAVPLTEQGMEQLMGYNHSVDAPFIAIVNAHEVCFGAKESAGYRFSAHFPTFQELITCLSR